MKSYFPFTRIDDGAEERAIFTDFVSYLNTNGVLGQVGYLLAAIDLSPALETFLLRNDDPKQRIFVPYCIPGCS